MGVVIRIQMRYRHPGAGIGVQQLRVNRLAHDDEGLQSDFGVAHPARNIVQPAPDDFLVRPAHPVGHRHRGIRRIARLLQLVGNAKHPRHAEENHQRAAVPRQIRQLLPGRHRHPPFGAGHNHRLGNFGHRKLGLERGGGGKGGAHPGNDLVVHPVGFQNPHLLQRGAVQRRVAALDAGHDAAGGHCVQGDGHNLRQRHLLAAIDPRAGPGEPRNLRRHQRIGVDNHIGLLNQPFGLQRQQLRVAGAGANNINLAVIRHSVAPLRWPRSAGCGVRGKAIIPQSETPA